MLMVRNGRTLPHNVEQSNTSLFERQRLRASSRLCVGRLLTLVVRRSQRVTLLRLVRLLCDQAKSTNKRLTTLLGS